MTTTIAEKIIENAGTIGCFLQEHFGVHTVWLGGNRFGLYRPNKDGCGMSEVVIDLISYQSTNPDNMRVREAINQNR